jgi:Flp pilus assembly pilin Flp
MNESLHSLARRLRRDQRGLTTVEYVIVLCLIAALAVATWQQFGSSVKGYLERAKQDIDTELQKQ